LPRGRKAANRNLRYCRPPELARKTRVERKRRSTATPGGFRIRTGQGACRNEKTASLSWQQSANPGRGSRLNLIRQPLSSRWSEIDVGHQQGKGRAARSNGQGPLLSPRFSWAPSRPHAHAPGRSSTRCRQRDASGSWKGGSNSPTARSNLQSEGCRARASGAGKAGSLKMAKSAPARS
jgi:hypothetical protein